MGQAIIRLGELNVENYVEGNINNYLVFSQLPNSKQHSSGIDGNVFISSTPTKEIVDADLDVEFDSNYNFVYSIGIDNKLKVVFEKNKYSSKAEAIDALKCISVIYELGQLVENAGLYYVVTRNSLGQEVQRTTALPLNTCVNFIGQIDATRDIQYGGFLKHEIMKSYTVV